MKTMSGLVVSMFFLVSCKKEPTGLTTPGTMSGSIDVILKKTVSAKEDASGKVSEVKVQNQLAVSGGDIPDPPVLR